MWMVYAYNIPKTTRALGPLPSRPVNYVSGMTDFGDVLALVRKNLADQYGENSGEIIQLDELVASMDHALPATSTPDSYYRVTLPSNTPHGFNVTATEALATRLIQLGIDKFKQKEKALLDSNWPQRFAQLKDGNVEDSQNHDVPCDSADGCKRLSQVMNACETARGQCYSIYTTYNQVTNVCNQIISALCACIFVGPAHICALKNFPYTCVFPYQVFSTFATGSSSVWEVIKTLSSLCRFHADPHLLPKIE